MANLQFNINEPFHSDTSGLRIKYSNGEERPVENVVSSPSEGELVTRDTTEVIYTAEVDGEVFTCRKPVEVKYCTGLSIANLPKVNYSKGEQLNLTGLVVQADYSDGSSENVSVEYTPVNGTILDGSTHEVTCKYVYYGEEVFTSFRISVRECVKVEAGLPNKTSYIGGELLDLTGMVLTAYYNDGTTETVVDYSTIPSVGSPVTLPTVEVFTTIYGDLFNSKIELNVKTITGLSADTTNMKTSYITGERLDVSGLIVNADLSDLTQISLDNYTTIPADGTVLNTNTKTITVVYDELMLFIPISVSTGITTWASGTENEIRQMFANVDVGLYSLNTLWTIGDERKVVLGGNINKPVTFLIKDLNGTKDGKNYKVLVAQKEPLSKDDIPNPQDYIDGDYKTAFENAIENGFSGLTISDLSLEEISENEFTVYCMI